MTEVSTEALRPYLNPDYWNGHSLGYGEATDAVPKALHSVIRPPKPIRHMFKERIAAMERIVPLETLNPGENFNAADYNEGTVVMFREEVLRGDPSQLEVGVETLREQPIPSRPTEFALAFGINANHSEFLTSDSVNYTNRVYCGMVGKSRDGEAVFYATTASLIERLGGGRVEVSGGWLSYDMPIEIGYTVHAKTKIGEFVQRVNLLEVVAYGEREREKEKAKGFMGRLALRHQSI